MPTNQAAVNNPEITKRIIELLNGMSGTSKVRGTRNQEEAETIFNREKPGIVLPDIHLPGKKGIEVLKYIKRTGRFWLVLAMTNQADAYYRRPCLKPGADFFDKRYEFRILPGTI